MPTKAAGSAESGSQTPHEQAAAESDVGKQSRIKSKGKGKTKVKSAKPPELALTPAKIEAERTALLAEKQAQLAVVLDRHDDLIREKFHMENFRMMVDYDPQVAKQDDSKVYQDYKSQHDLLETATLPSMSPRKTRSSYAGLLSLAGPSASFPSLSTASTPAASLSRLSPVKSPTNLRSGAKSKALPVVNGHPPQAKGKGKEKAVDVDEYESISGGLARGRVTMRQSATAVPTTRQMRKRPGPALDLPEPGPSTVKNESISHPRKRRKVESDVAVAVPDETLRVVVASPLSTSISAPVNGRVLRGKPRPPEPAEPPPSAAAEAKPATPTPTSAPVGRVMPHRTAANRPLVSVPPLPSRRAVAPPVPPAPSSVRRVKLLVRRPAPKFLSHPRQRPPPPKFNSSLGTFLGSYVDVAGQTFAVDHESDGGNQDLARLAETEAVLWERVAAMKRAGKWFGSDSFDVFRSGGLDAAGCISGAGTPSVAASPDAPPSGATSRPDDTWAAVVRSVVVYGKRNRASSSGSTKMKRTRGQLVAAQVAAKIQAYWDGQAAKLEKGRAVEERRLRVLAKTVMKLVSGEWKKAVFHIREQERLKLEAEELKRGHEHLDAILDQSGHILETQQGDLTRGGDAFRSRSRSSSVSATIMGWEEEDDDEEEEDDMSDGEGEDADEENHVSEEGGPRQEEEEEEEEPDQVDRNDIDTSMSLAEGDAEETELNSGALLAAYPHTPRLATPSLPASSPPGSVRDSRPSQSSVYDEEQPDADDEDDDGESAMAVEDMMSMDVPPSSPIRSPEVRPGDPEPPPVHSSVPPDDHVDLPTPIIDRSHSPSPTVSLQDPIDSSILAPRDDVAVEDTPTSPSPVQNSPQIAVEAGPDPAPDAEEDEDLDSEEETAPEPEIPAYLRPYAVAPVDYDTTRRVTPPLLLRGLLRPYQQSGLEWLASLHLNNLNGILADEMGLGKTIQTISLLAHLACDRGIWGPHLIIVPTSVLLNWEMEFKKFLPGFRILSYHGSTKRRQQLRQGWNEKHRFNVCITSYTLASRDATVFKRKPWYYMILDEAHMIKNFKSQRWNTLLMFRSFRRLLLTGTPLQNNLTELWALLQFLMSGSDFVNLKEFGEWFSNPLERAIEAGSALDEDTMQRVTKLHTVLRPYLLRRLKRDVEKELPSKYEHLILCPLSKRQRFLYDEFMSRAHTRDALQSGVYQKIANILMQLRKVCNHPDLFEVRPIVTSFAMERSAIADFEIKELLLRRRLQDDGQDTVNIDLFGFRFIDRQGSSLIAAQETRRLDGTTRLPFISEIPDVPPPKDTRTVAGFRAYSAYQKRAATISRWAHIGYINRLRCNSHPIYSREILDIAQRFHHPLLPLSALDTRARYLDTVYPINAAIKSYTARADDMSGIVDRFTFITPPVVALDMPRVTLAGQRLPALTPDFDDVLHRASVKLQIAFPDPSLLQYDCGKLQQLTRLLREKKAGGHRILIFTQMTKILDILEIFLNFHGYLYLRLDGATKIEDRQYITERFNADPRIFCFIASSRSGGVGINLTGADTVVFYDSDFNPQMDRQCEDRAHRIGQIRDVHIYRFVSQHTVEEAMLRKANQKRSLDDLVIQKGEFDWRSLFADDGALATALGEFDDTEDARAAQVAAREEVVLEGQDKADFLDGETADGGAGATLVVHGDGLAADPIVEEEAEEGGSVADYMIAFVERDAEFFREWKL
ncbi:SNF2 family N-terminal domain-containing protein [Mycena belliarum]|uniref:DNA helicase n=1 Tax=Mycena belliarum TaxID=1033014 RepID=A0AAD6UHQ1_9AGAR|nr:SNF2 family N-terminal domain-containing protein [Mycena belliae]